jgi:hypothetical protein
MNMVRLISVALGASFAVLACSAGNEPVAEPTTESAAALDHGCRFVCPKCHPNEVCPLGACVEDCSPAHQPCIDNTMCAQGYEWSPTKCSCVK